MIYKQSIFSKDFWNLITNNNQKQKYNFFKKENKKKRKRKYLKWKKKNDIKVKEKENKHSQIAKCEMSHTRIGPLCQLWTSHTNHN